MRQHAQVLQSSASDYEKLSISAQKALKINVFILSGGNIFKLLNKINTFRKTFNSRGNSQL